MNISVQQFASKIEQHLEEMKRHSESSPKVRQHAAAIQALCDLMLDSGEQPAQPEVKTWVPSHPVQVPPQFGAQPSAAPKKRQDEDDEGNGDSIFDF
ncbi:YwdI family protein [Fictibacillus iocasae]|uniref:YwdI family protein n=1 Tax=Fictibacillus iocasae TaxID=2715437 RepID=A0ABW2NQ04_9BACL